MPSTVARETKAERIDLRATREVKETIQRAADLLGTTTSAFVVTNAYDAARKVIAEQETLLLADHDRDLFFSMLDQPPRPNAALKRLLRQGKGASTSP